jgi:hypothetical protein
VALRLRSLFWQIRDDKRLGEFDILVSLDVQVNRKVLSNLRDSLGYYYVSRPLWGILEVYYLTEDKTDNRW